MYSQELQHTAECGGCSKMKIHTTVRHNMDVLWSLLYIHIDTHTTDGALFVCTTVEVEQNGIMLIGITLPQWAIPVNKNTPPWKNIN